MNQREKVKTKKAAGPPERLIGLLFLGKTLFQPIGQEDNVWEGGDLESSLCTTWKYETRKTEMRNNDWKVLRNLGCFLEGYRLI